jgi:hypothetical protein
MASAVREAASAADLILWASSTSPTLLWLTERSCCCHEHRPFYAAAMGLRQIAWSAFTA